MGKYFGTDGIRGQAFEKLNETLAFRVGQGLSQAFDLKKVIIGYDTRASSPMLAHLIASGALSQGLDVLFAGICSTPMLAYYAKKHQMIGIMITASHNPYTDNGIKVFNRGYKSNTKEEEAIENSIDHPIMSIKPFGQFVLAKDFEDTYVTLYDAFPTFKSILKVAYDSANGGNYQIAKRMFDHYTQDAFHIGCHPNGLNINVDCGSTHMDHILSYVKKHHLDIGFAFDGDGDRLLVCDQYRIYDGDEIIYMIAKYLVSKGLLKDHHIVLTKMSNPGLLKVLNEDGISYTLTDVGDKYVSEVLLKNGFSIGGENSGHIIINQLLHTGDGLLAAIYLLHILNDQKCQIKDLLGQYKPYPYRLENIKNVDKSILKRPDTDMFLSDIKASLGDHALLLVRPSGTEPLIRITVSHQDENVVNKTIDKIVNYIKKGSEMHG